MLHSLGKNKVAMLLVVLMLSACLMMGLFSAGVSAANPTTHNNIKITFGDTSNPTWPESEMDFTFVSGDTYHADYTGDDSATYYPDILSIYIEPVSGTISTITASGVSFVTYDEDGDPTVSDTTTVNDDHYYTIQPKATWGSTRYITVTNNSSQQFILNFDAPKSNPASAGSNPDDVLGYLPVGQYASGSGWGSIFTDGTNLTGTTEKFVGGYAATGVSLGAFGGYVQFDMGENSSITNSNLNPYGIDFVVYGNPFNGNPEAGCVQVSNNGTDWFTLAGSRHYESNTTLNTKVAYLKIAAVNTTIGGQTFSTAGIYYSRNYAQTSSTTQATVDARIGAATWTLFKNSTSWWPEYTSENYGGVYGSPNNVIWNRSGSAEVISMTGLTEVIDDGTQTFTGTTAEKQAAATNFYGYGYVDVRANGTSYGTAINPYASLPAASSGGDGFDLAWAVDANGDPASVASARYVRVYTGVLYNAGVFGETSTEVCGLYVTSNTAGSDVGTTGAPTMTLNAATSYNVTGSSGGTATVTIPSNDNSATFTLTATAAGTDNFWMNNSKTSSGTAVSFTMPAAGADKLVRIVAQDDNDQPYVLLVKVHKNA